MLGKNPVKICCSAEKNILCWVDPIYKMLKWKILSMWVWLSAASPTESWQKVADFRWACGCSVDWEHEHCHCTGWQQEALSHEWRNHPDVPADEPYLWTHGPGGGFTGHGEM